MNTENNTTPQTNTSPSVPDANIPPIPGSDMAQPPQNKTMLSNLRIVVILAAVLALAGGAAFLAIKQKGNPAPINDAPITTAPSVTSNPSGLKMEVSDDPEVLEKELNDVNVDNIDQDLDSVNEDLNSL